MMKRRFITARDLKNWVDKLDDGDLDLPVAVSEKTCGITNDYFNNDEIIYAVRVSSKYNKNQEFNGWLIEGLRKQEIFPMKS